MDSEERHTLGQVGASAAKRARVVAECDVVVVCVRGTGTHYR